MSAHLKANRRVILSRAVVAGLAGLVPVPWLDDLLAGAVRASLVRRLAAIRNVDVDANAVDALAHPYGSRILSAASFGAAALATTRRAFRKVAASLLVVRRADEAIQTFITGTLFDHYCQKHHVGLGLDGKRALAVRQAIDHAASRARNQVIERAFRRGLKVSAKAATSVPRTIFSLVTRRRGGPITPDMPPSLDERVEAAASTSMAGRALKVVEAEVARAERSWLDALTHAFDEAWARAKVEGV
jgi:uncharacterized protein (DUF697 family)